MNGLRTKVTWKVNEDNYRRTITASVLLPDKEYMGMALDVDHVADYDRAMMRLLKNLSDAGWATRIIDDNNIEVVRLALPADIKHEQRCKA